MCIYNAYMYIFAHTYIYTLQPQLTYIIIYWRVCLIHSFVVISSERNGTRVWAGSVLEIVDKNRCSNLLMALRGVHRRWHSTWRRLLQGKRWNGWRGIVVHICEEKGRSWSRSGEAQSWGGGEQEEGTVCVSHYFLDVIAKETPENLIEVEILLCEKFDR